VRIGILETGGPPPALAPRFGDYPAMFQRLLGADYDYATFAVEAGVLPGRPEACDAYVVTGSPAGVYDDLPWIDPLKRFLVEAKGRAALVGVCFGHQIMAEAFGGRAAKSDRGWGVGLHSYAIQHRRPWMDDAPAIAVPVSHQDQVVERPPAAEVLGGSAFTPYGVLAYSDQPAISFQCHPEFEPAYAEALVKGRRGDRLAPELADAAVASLHQPDDRARVGEWIRRFLARA
jgi:GMP synthase-like glutamine amidotransferase